MRLGARPQILVIIELQFNVDVTILRIKMNRLLCSIY
jgi:hypothetical protein